MKKTNNHEPYTEITEQLLRYAESIEIPDELDLIVQRTLKQETSSSKERIILMKFKKWMTKLTTSAAILAVGFVGAANISPTFAQSMSDVPVLGKLVEVVTFTQFNYKENTFEANINTPIIEGLENKPLQESLNEKYLEENKRLFEQFEKEVAKLKDFDTDAHLGLDSGFEVKTNNEQLLSIGRYIVNTVGSSSTTMTYDTIDKQNEIIITLPSLFKDDSYVAVISENIKTQMRERMINDENLLYWIAGDPTSLDGFDSIDVQQNFYISDEGKLVISFDKYTVGPGSMGIQEFEIPTEVLQDILVSNIYIK